MTKASYKVDLRALHALCEANYARLLRLFPDYESRNSYQFSLAAAQIHFEVLERSRYTTLFRLQCFLSSSSASAVSAVAAADWLPPLRLEARAYHDAAMLEVVRFQSGGKTEGRYQYPNPAMHQQDEKLRQNSFLADWLAHCQRHGEANVAGFLKPGTEHA